MRLCVSIAYAGHYEPIQSDGAIGESKVKSDRLVEQIVATYNVELSSDLSQYEDKVEDCQCGAAIMKRAAVVTTNQARRRSVGVCIVPIMAYTVHQYHSCSSIARCRLRAADNTLPE